MSVLNALKTQYFEVKDQHRLYGAALPQSIRVDPDEKWKFELRDQRFIQNKTWHVRAVGYPLGELEIELSESDVYGKETKYSSLGIVLLGFGVVKTYDTKFILFLTDFLNGVAHEMKSRYEEMLATLPEETRELSQRMLEVLRATQFEKRGFQNQIAEGSEREAKKNRGSCCVRERKKRSSENV